MRKRVRWISFFCAAGVLAGALYFLWRDTKNALDRTRRESFLCASVELSEGAGALAELLLPGGSQPGAPLDTARLRLALARCRSAALILERDLAPDDAAARTKPLFSYFSSVEQAVFSDAALSQGEAEQYYTLLCRDAKSIAVAMERLSLSYFEQIPLYGTAAEYRAAAEEALDALGQQLTLRQSAAGIPFALAAFSVGREDNIGRAAARALAGEYIGKAAACLGKEGMLFFPQTEYCFYCRNYSVGISGSDGALIDLQAQLPPAREALSLSDLRQAAQNFAKKYSPDAVFSSEAYFSPLYYARFLMPQGTVYVVLSCEGKTVGYFGTK